MIFKDPWVLALVPVLGIVFFLLRNKRSSSLVFSSIRLLKPFRQTVKLTLARGLVFLRLAAAVLFTIALAGPRLPSEETKFETEGIHIVLAVDCSGSMLAEDFTVAGSRQNRLAVVKQVVKEFIRKRTSDRIAMIAFAARAYTVCPLTLDYDWLIENLKRIEIGTIEDGTSVGSGLASSLNRLKDIRTANKIVILLTDGVNNTGKISPLAAAESAKALGVRVYTIGAGSKGPVPFPVKDAWGRTVYQKVVIELDETTLKKIADVTGGRYYRATDVQSLNDIYDEIDALEKTPIEELRYGQYREAFHYFLVPGMLLLLIEIVLANTWLRKLP